jgi:endo-1,4-beta-D-glucanase Y
MRAMIMTAALLFGTLAPRADTVIRPEEWAAYTEAYVTDEGRVVDTGNNNISHSESQGYGLVLAVLAEDRATFERIWTFTRTELLVRDDGLAAWRWDPASEPHVTDTNNATDGDMLIAYGLALAGGVWSDTSYADAARTIIRAIGRNMLVDVDGMPAILPGAAGFAAGEDGASPILNPSYWIFETLPVFAAIDPVIDWHAVGDTGLEIIRRARQAPAGLPPDWLVLEDGGVLPAPDLPAEFGYNGIRIPVYLMRAGVNPALLDPFRDNANDEGLHKVDAVTGERIEPITEPGYRLIAAAMDCVVDNKPVPEDLRTMAATSYYAATLQLLLLDHLRRSRPDCVGDAAP